MFLKIPVKKWSYWSAEWTPARLERYFRFCQSSRAEGHPSFLTRVNPNSRWLFPSRLPLKELFDPGAKARLQSGKAIFFQLKEMMSQILRCELLLCRSGIRALTVVTQSKVSFCVDLLWLLILSGSCGHGYTSASFIATFCKYSKSVVFRGMQVCQRDPVPFSVFISRFRRVDSICTHAAVLLSRLQGFFGMGWAEI